MQTIPRIRIFLSSPGDVAEERQVARQTVERLKADPLVRERVDLEIIAWDDPTMATPMLATMTPQEAINRGLAKPSDCDIVIVIFWARMGTPLPHPEYHKADGGPYLSGTEWEYLDAVNASLNEEDGLPLVVVYRRGGAPALQLDDPDFDKKREQWARVQRFFDTFTSTDGSIRQGYNQHKSPDDFATKLEGHLKKLLGQVISIYEKKPKPSEVPVPAEEVPPVPLWKGSPFPGLRSFTPVDEAIFFGRGGETDALIDRLRTHRVVAVVGASGSGKSSLVGAGVLPRLAANSIEGSKDWLLPTVDADRQWRGLRFAPGEINDNPFDALAARLAPIIQRKPREVTAELMADPDAIVALVAEALAGRPEWAQALLFIDQFEELFTLTARHYRAAYVQMLTTIAASERVRVVLTLRADFYARCVEDPALAEMLEDTTFPLAAPRQTAIQHMIERPAERAGLIFEDGLIEKILDDTGDDPGALALLAYALDQLYQRGSQASLLTNQHYRAIGGVRGAIGERAEAIFTALPQGAQQAFDDVFRELVEVDERGEPTRRRALVATLTAKPGAAVLIEAMTDARLLVTNRGEGGATVEVAHEALLRSWDKLRLWIDAQAYNLQLRRRLENEARAWQAADETHRHDFLLLGSRLEEAERWLTNFPAGADVTAFIQASLTYRTAQQEKEYATARRMRNFRWASVVLAAMVVLALGATILAGLTALTARDESSAAQALRNTVIFEATVFGVQQARAATQVAGLGIIPEREITLSPQDILAEATQIAARAAWQPIQQEFNGIEMMQVPAGCFMMGSILYTDTSVHRQCFDSPFWIGKYEVTNIEYARFSDAGGYDNPDYWTDAGWAWRSENAIRQPSYWTNSDFNAPQQPVVAISWYEAAAFARWTEMRLCSEREWEYAARGPNSYLYPWGNEFVADNVVFSENSDGRTAPVGSRPSGISWIGALDMSGNAWEWTLSEYRDYPYTAEDGRESISSHNRRVVRGGSWIYVSDDARAAYRDYGLYPLYRFNFTGFRVCRPSTQ